MQNNKLFGRIFAPGVQRIEELLTIDFLAINDSSSLGCDCHPRISAHIKLRDEIRLRDKTHNLLGRTSTNQSLGNVVIINRLNQVVCIFCGHDLTTFDNIQLLDYNFGRQNVSTINQLRSRNIDQNLTINSTIIHSWFEWSERMFRGCCIEVATV